jgi:hypothetical protein
MELLRGVDKTGNSWRELKGGTAGDWRGARRACRVEKSDAGWKLVLQGSLSPDARGAGDTGVRTATHNRRNLLSAGRENPRC